MGTVTGANTFNFTPGYVGGEATDLGSTNQLAFYDHSGSDSFTHLDLILGFVNPPATPPDITGVTAYTNVGNVNGSRNISAGAGTSHTGLNITPSGPTQLNSGKVNAVLLSAMPGISNSEQTSNYDAAETKDGITQTGGYALYAYNLAFICRQLRQSRAARHHLWLRDSEGDDRFGLGLRRHCLRQRLHKRLDAERLCQQEWSQLARCQSQTRLFCSATVSFLLL